MVAQLTTELRDSSEKYKRVVETAQQGFAILQNQQVVFLNEKFADMLGQEEKHIINLPLEQYAASSRQAGLKEKLQQLDQDPNVSGRLESSRTLTRGILSNMRTENCAPI